MKFVGNFDPSKINDYINPVRSKELIEEKISKKQKLTSGEKLLLITIIKRINSLSNKDLEQIKKHSINADVTTSEGRKRKL